MLREESSNKCEQLFNDASLHTGEILWELTSLYDVYLWPDEDTILEFCRRELREEVFKIPDAKSRDKVFHETQL